MEFLLDPKIWASFLTFTALEIVLGIDMLFITIISGRLPSERQPAARPIADNPRRHVTVLHLRYL
ncbi:MAG: TerC family protein [Actinobacteria bacterium]|nr:TerC family protein [Actinomycetota bacterium]